MLTDFGVVAWHEEGRWSVSILEETRDIGYLIDRLKSQQTNGGAVALIAIEDEFFIVARALGTSMQMMISDVTYALDYDVAVDLVEIIDIPFPEEDDDPQSGGDIDLLADLGMNAMELEALCADDELFPDQQIDAIATRLGFGDEFVRLYELP